VTVNRLLRFLFENPILLVIVGLWIAGVVGNVLKAAQRRQQQGRGADRPQPEVRERPRPEADERRSAEEVAREMRRILGMEESAPPEPKETEVVRPRPVPVVVRRDVALPERAPTPARPTTQARRLPKHVDPHVGERIQQRHGPQSGRVGHKEQGKGLGSLGGRVQEVHGLKRQRRGLVDLTDLQRAFVMSEVLGKPLALRRPDDSQP
jgi:hypothetical protein